MQRGADTFEIAEILELEARVCQILNGWLDKRHAERCRS
jgi:hypothetical protein